MAVIRLKHVEQFKDRLGIRRFYYRKGKGKRIVLVGLPGSEQFNQSYQAAIAQSEHKPRSEIGTFNSLARDYMQFGDFVRQKPSTQKAMRYRIEKFCSEHGHRLVKQMTRQDVSRLMNEIIATPAEANYRLRVIRALVRYAIDNDQIGIDPTLRIKSNKGGEHHTWTETEIAQYEKHWSIGTRQRLAFDLHIYTGQRRADVCKMKWSAIANDQITVVQEKGGSELQIPLHTNLSRSIAIAQRNSQTIISTDNSKPYTVESYGHLIARAIKAASLPDRCVTHGLRKAAARRLAEAGCTTLQIMAITGHKTLSEVERYTRAVSQVRLAGQAMASLGKPEID